MSDQSPHNDKAQREQYLAMAEQLRHKRGCPGNHHRPYEVYGDPHEGEPSAIEPYDYTNQDGVKLADIVRCGNCGEQIVDRVGQA
jgi:hypothetical protein